MRKDVRIGLAVAGVLVAVLIVYLLIPKKDGDRDQLAQNTDDTQQTDDQTGGAGEPVTPGTGEDGAADEQPGTGDEGATGSGTPGTQGSNDPFADRGARTGTDASASQTGATGNSDEGSRADAGAAGAGGNANWSQLLDGSAARPLFVTETPSPTGNGATAPKSNGIGTGAQAPPTTNEADATGVTLPPTSSAFNGAGAGSATTQSIDEPRGVTDTPPANTGADVTAGGTTHVIQPDETLSSIAAAAYGSAKYYPLIQKANPGLNERALKPGTTIKIPPRPSDAGAGTSSPSADSPSAADAAAPVNSTTEYRVRPGDSLYKISMKLYGKATETDELYQLNRQTIGDDPERLKVGMLLKLPAAPTAASAR